MSTSEDENAETTSISKAEKEEFERRIKHWESLYGELKDQHTELSKKYEEVARRNNSSQAPEAELEKCKITQSYIDDAVKELRVIADEVRSGSCASNKERIEELDQYGRKNILLLHKLLFPTDKYDLDLIEWVVEELNKMFPDLKYPVQVSHIDDAHPLRTRSGEKVFIVKFGPRWMKNEIYKRRAQLKTSAYKHISITEQLTKHTQSLLDQTRTVVGQDVKVFTNNCVISTKFLNRKYRVKTYKDLQFLAKKVGYKHPLTPPGFQASPVFQVNPHGSAPQHDYDAGLVNTAAAYNMHPIDPYAYVPPPGGRGNGGAWSAANT